MINPGDSNVKQITRSDYGLHITANDTHFEMLVGGTHPYSQEVGLTRDEAVELWRCLGEWLRLTNGAGFRGQ